MSEFSDKVKTVGVLRGGRSRSREVSGREHPDSHLPYKAVTDEAGATVTEHSEPGSGVACRQDVEIRPDPVKGSGMMP